MSYDITENKRDLDLLDNVEPNIGVRGGDYFMECTMSMRDDYPARSFSIEDFEFSKLELYQGVNYVEVSKEDVIALAKHFGII
jgi:hypothetical protein